jgi:hypothetical protein
LVRLLKDRSLTISATGQDVINKTRSVSTKIDEAATAAAFATKEHDKIENLAFSPHDGGV